MTITPEKLLTVAADHIKVFGWVGPRDNSVPQFGKRTDLRGSLMVAIPAIVRQGGPNWRDHCVEYTRARWAAEEQLARFIEPVTAGVGWEDLHRFLNRWNDIAGRTQAEVEAVLRGGAAAFR